MEQALGAGVLYFIFLFLVFLIGIAITRWVFRTEKMIEQFELQTGLLILIAKKAGASPDDLRVALGTNTGNMSKLIDKELNTSEAVVKI